MKVKDAIRILDKKDVKVLAGHDGVNRQICVIEVMEAPDVESWASEGSLILTTFYAVNADENKQYETVKTFIKNNCAGIMIKLGRFIQELPTSIINLCEENDFPLLIIKEDLPYRDILNVLNGYLYGKQRFRFDDIDFGTIESALESLADKYFCSIYVEDYMGRLLYSTYNHFKDGWRSQHVLFAPPEFKQYTEALDNWALDHQKQSIKYFIDRPGVKDRVVMPMMIKGAVSVFVHFVFNQRNKIQLLEEAELLALKEKMYDLFIGEFFTLQQLGHDSLDISNKGSETGQYIVLLLDRKMNHQVMEEKNPFIHYEGLFLKNMMQVMGQVEGVQIKHMFHHQNHMFLLLSVDEDEDIAFEKLKAKLEKKLKGSLVRDVWMIISTSFQYMKDLPHLLDTMLKVYNDKDFKETSERIVLHKNIGINAFLSELSERDDVKGYAKSILNPLLTKDDHLLETLQVYIEENGHVTRTADRLFLNRKTVTNRLAYIHENLNMDLNNANDIFILHFCMKVMNRLQ